MSYSSESLVQTAPATARSVFFDLFSGPSSESQLEGARHFLAEQLAQAVQLDADLPEDRAELYAWMQADV